MFLQSSRNHNPVYLVLPGHPRYKSSRHSRPHPLHWQRRMSGLFGPPCSITANLLLVWHPSSFTSYSASKGVAQTFCCMISSIVHVLVAAQIRTFVNEHEFTKLGGSQKAIQLFGRVSTSIKLRMRCSKIFVRHG
jgi:hypothetical protein